ncbi:isoprenyl transferase [Bacillus marinisedimentorum]|uniref:isoprenyl transferase n=1 Tax=Bacillus marinisedimentorum TaxID=1821260 RepID=UPI0007E23F97|nr:isoprenyl transferase [Bacillus marinisedimentorum]
MLDKLLKRQTDQENTGAEIDPDFVPKHIAIIMDGNGRWAKQRNLPRILGHREGMKTVKEIVKKANSLSVKQLTLYAFSTENWKRPKTEVDYLMKLPEEFLGSFLPELMEENVRVRVMGEEEELPEHTRRAVNNAMEQTAGNDGLTLNFALNYGSRHEIMNAVKEIAEDVRDGRLSAGDISEEMFSGRLLSSGLEDPDLLIRTSGEIRLSNFMLWQLAYTELWFTDILWPDFTGDHLAEAVRDFQQRSRRFGGV